MGRGITLKEPVVFSSSGLTLARSYCASSSFPADFRRANLEKMFPFGMNPHWGRGGSTDAQRRAEVGEEGMIAGSEKGEGKGQAESTRKEVGLRMRESGCATGPSFNRRWSFALWPAGPSASPLDLAA